MMTSSPNPVAAVADRAKRRARVGGVLQMLGWLGAILLGVLHAPAAAAQASRPSQYDVQAVYLFDFTKFVRWPPGGAGGSLDICVAAQSSYADALSRIVAGEHVDGRALAVRPVQRPEQEAGCGILFIGSSMKDSIDNMLTAAIGKPTLTVSDMPGFLDRGGMIQFVMVGDRVRFEVALRPVDRSGLAVSSELLKVAVAVTGTPHGGPQ